MKLQLTSNSQNNAEKEGQNVRTATSNLKYYHSTASIKMLLAQGQAYNETEINPHICG